MSIHWQGRLLQLGGYNHLYYVSGPLWYILGPTSSFAYYNYIMTNPQKGIWSFYNIRHDQSTMGIDPMNNISNNNKNTLCSYIILILPLNKKGILQHHQAREREDNIINNIKWEDNIINIILVGVSINHRKFSSSITSSFSKECHHHLHQYVSV